MEGGTGPIFGRQLWEDQGGPRESRKNEFPFWEFCTQKIAENESEVQGLRGNVELNLTGLGQAHSHFVNEAEKQFREVHGRIARWEEREKILLDQVGTLHRELGEVREAVQENAREGESSAEMSWLK